MDKSAQSFPVPRICFSTKCSGQKWRNYPCRKDNSSLLKMGTKEFAGSPEDRSFRKFHEDRGVYKYIVLCSTKVFRTLWSAMEMREGHYWPHRGNCLEAPYSFFSLCICRSTSVKAANWTSQQGALACIGWQQPAGPYPAQN